MRTIKIVVIHPFDPWGIKIGGAEVFIKEFVKNSPDNFEIEFIGVSSDPAERPVGRRKAGYLGGRKISFYPVLYVRDENIKTRIPLSLIFTIVLFFSRVDYGNKVIFFNRIEPAILFKRHRGLKILMVHNDVQEQIYKKKGEVIWNRIPWLYRIELNR